MSKANQLRQKLVASNNRLAYDGAIAIMGGRNGMTNMLKTGELTIEGEGDEREVVLDPGYKARRTLPIKRKASKRAKKTAHKKRARKAARSGKTFKGIADDLSAADRRRDDLRIAVLDNLKACVNHLVDTCLDQIEGIENNPTLRAAVESAARAANIAAKAG